MFFEVIMLILLAVTTLEKLQAVPQRFWINAAIFIIGGWLAIMLLRHAAQMNKVILADDHTRLDHHRGLPVDLGAK